MESKKSAARATDARPHLPCLLLSEIATMIEGERIGSSDPKITGVAGIRDARSGDLTFLATRQYKPYLDSTGASAVIVNGIEGIDLPAVRVEDPALAFVKVVRHFAAAVALTFPRSVHPTAVVHETARLGREVSIGPHVVIEEGVVIGDRTTVLPGTCIFRHTRIGTDGLIYPNVIIREHTEIGDRVILHGGVVLGSDGFGFVPEGARYLKVPHIGRVVLEDDVEVGANSCIDRATTGVTRVGRGTKIDNLVQVAHNVEIGSDSLLCAQVGVSGSTKIGDHVRLAGQAGLVDHIQIGDGATVGAQGGVTKSVAPGTCVSGYPARPHDQAMRQQASLVRLPEIRESLRRLRKRLDVLESRWKAR